jgi:signal-transduction protein with cAMP-binding, CBS, and nucleotidyltransferase domain
MLKEIQWLSGLGESSLKKIWSISKEEIVAEGDELFKKHGLGESVLIIVRGTVRLTYEKDIADYAGAGATLGELALLSSESYSFDAVAESNVQLLKLPAEELKKIFTEHPEIQEKLWHAAGTRAAERKLRAMEPFKHWGQTRLKRWLMNGTVVRPPKDRLQMVKGTIVLLSGKASRFDEHGTKKGFEPISVLRSAKVFFEENSVVFLCPAIKQASDQINGLSLKQPQASQ